MMNRSTSADSYVPSLMSFVGLEGSRLQPKPHLWDWEANNTSVDIPTILTPPTNQPFLDFYPQPPLLPTNTFPFYPLIKREEGLGLNLGHRTYFSSADAPPPDRGLMGRGAFYSLGHHQHHNPPRCQAEGCKADLSGAKHYHRRHKVCEFHSKAVFVVAAGIQQRFCQQCSRFHVLSEFDESKRSCRKRLADHNRRRRKPPQLQHDDIPAPKNHMHTPASTSKPSTSMKTSSTLSLGGARDERMGWAAQSLYQHQHQQQQLSLFNNQNVYNEGTQAAGSDHHPNSLLNLGFDVDFM